MINKRHSIVGMKEENKKLRKAMEIFVNDKIQMSKRDLLHIRLPRLSWELCRYAAELKLLRSASGYVVHALHEQLKRDGILYEKKGLLRVTDDHLENAQSYFESWGNLSKRVKLNEKKNI